MKKYNPSPWLKYVGLSTQLLVLLAAAVYGGIMLDKKFSLSPLFTCVLPLLVLIGSFYTLIKETSKRKKDKDDKP